MKNAALRSSTLALGLALFGSISARIEAVDAYTDPVGYYTLTIQGGSDNVMSLPMVRDAVFSGTVSGGITATGFTALAGTQSPGWTASQFKYAAPAQPQTFYVEFTSGQLKGLYYKIDDNGTNTVSLDTEGDSLLDHDFPTVANQALAVGDSFKIRPYWRVKDVLEVSGAPVIEGSPDIETQKDQVLFPNYTAVAVNKAPSLILYYDLGQGGWRRSTDETTDWGNHVIRPNEAFIVRRRNATSVPLTNLGGVLVNTAISFVPGASQTSGNDTYISIARPAPVSLDDSGLSALVKPSPDIESIEDQVFAFGSTPGMNRAPSERYFYLQGAGWRKFPDDVTNVGQTVKLEPGKAYILRKKSTNVGGDWINTPNY